MSGNVTPSLPCALHGIYIDNFTSSFKGYENKGLQLNMWHFLVFA
jgi:hypothetical protein